MHGTDIHDGSDDLAVNAAIKIQTTWITKDVNCKDNKEKKFSQGVWTFRQYERTITKSLAEEPTDAGTFFEVDAVLNHRSTKFCSCNDGTTG